MLGSTNGSSSYYSDYAQPAQNTTASAGLSSITCHTEITVCHSCCTTHMRTGALCLMQPTSRYQRPFAFTVYSGTGAETAWTFDFPFISASPRMGCEEGLTGVVHCRAGPCLAA